MVCIWGPRAVTAQKFRRRAEICMRFAERATDPNMALRLRLMAGEYLVRAEEEESQMASGAHGLEETPSALGAGESAPSANPEPPTK